MYASLIVLDLDGTIVRLPIDYDSMRKELQDLFLKYGIKKEFRPLCSTIEESCNILKAKNSENQSVKVYDSALKIIERFELESLDKTEMIDNADNFIKNMGKRGKKLAIFSSNTRKCVEGALTKFKLLEYFDIIISRNDVKEIKPAIDGLELISKKFNLKPESMILIGDTTYDMQSAKSFGSKSIGILNKRWSKKDFMSSGADIIIENLSECLKVIE